MLAMRAGCFRQYGKQMLQGLKNINEHKCGKSTTSTIADSVGYIPPKVTADVLLTNANRIQTLDRLLTAPPIGLHMHQNSEETISAAVLIALCTNREGGVSILYTKRSSQLSRHVRQTSFPGGIRDASDLDYIDCALRETEEEIGLPRSRVRIWGTGSLITPPQTAAIMPVVGEVIDFDLSELRLNADEVEEAFTIPVEELANPQALHYTQFKTGYSAPLFMVRNYKVWGITGFLTHSFLNCLLPEGLQGRIRYIRPFTSE